MNLAAHQLATLKHGSP